jgi:hypothetical protein
VGLAKTMVSDYFSWETAVGTCESPPYINFLSPYYETLPLHHARTCMQQYARLASQMPVSCCELTPRCTCKLAVAYAAPELLMGDKCSLKVGTGLPMPAQCRSLIAHCL